MSLENIKKACLTKLSNERQHALPTNSMYFHHSTSTFVYDLAATIDKSLGVGGKEKEWKERKWEQRRCSKANESVSFYCSLNNYVQILLSGGYHSTWDTETTPDSPHIFFFLLNPAIARLTHFDNMTISCHWAKCWMRLILISREMWPVCCIHSPSLGGVNKDVCWGTYVGGLLVHRFVCN